MKTQRQRFQWERQWMNSGRLASCIHQLEQMAHCRSTLPDEHNKLMRAVQILRHIVFRANIEEAWERFKTLERYDLINFSQRRY